MKSEPIHISDLSFEKTVLQNSLPVLVDFWAPWCGPCKGIAPILEKLAKEYSDKLIICKINTDENKDWPGRYEITSIPTLLFFLNGQIAYRQTGAAPEGTLRMFINEFIDIADSIHTSKNVKN